jgi:hypothetical protein
LKIKWSLAVYSALWKRVPRRLGMADFPEIHVHSILDLLRRNISHIGRIDVLTTDISPILGVFELLFAR